VRAQRSAWRLAAQRACSLCCPLRPCAARNRAARETRRAAQGTLARVAACSCTLMTQPAPGAGSPTDDIHSAGTPRVSLLLCCHRRLQDAHRSPRSGLNSLDLRDISFSTFGHNFLHFLKRAYLALSGSEQATERFLSVLDHSRCAYNCAAHMNLKIKMPT
jgi:hypothetical protein